jgi:hypothetical protein
MPRPVRKKSTKKRTSLERHLPLGRTNYILMVTGIVIIIIGYACMLEGSVDGILPIYIAPVLLILGYCVVIPVALLYKKSDVDDSQPVKQG